MANTGLLEDSGIFRLTDHGAGWKRCAQHGLYTWVSGGEMADGRVHAEVKETGQDPRFTLGMEGRVKGRGSGTEIGQRSDPGGPVEFLNRASGIYTEHSAPPQMLPEQEEQQALPRRVTRKENNRQLSFSCQLS